MKTKLFLAALVLGTSTMLAADLKTGQLSNVQRLTSDNGRYENPVWSPDGQQIAFNAEGFNGLYVMNPSTKAVKQLSSDGGIGYMMQWSADSREILVRDTRWLATAEGGVDRTHAAFAINAISGQKVRMSDDNQFLKPAAWRYDANGNKTIVCNAKVRPSRLAKVPSAQLNVRTATAPAANCGISFVEDFDNLYVVDQAGNQRVLNAGASFNAMLSPDGKRVIFNEMDDIVVINVDGTGKRKVGAGFRPQWVGNSQIVYERTQDNGHNYTAGELYILNVDAGTEKALTATKDRIEMFPNISPDGRQIVFTSQTDGQLYIADLK